MQDLCIKDSQQIAKAMRILILELALAGGDKAAHIGGALSCIDFLAVSNQIFRLSDSPSSMQSLVLSKGHACLSLYSLLIRSGIVNKEDVLNTFEKDGSLFLGHPCRCPEIGINFSTGSLGNGLAHALGLAIYRNQNSISISSKPVIAIVGDGECNEGLIWECLEFISQLRLPNLIVFVDCNGWQQTQESLYSNDKYESFYQRIKTYDISVFKVDGHNHREIYNALLSNESKSKVILGMTVKGKGFSQLEDINDWHHGILTQSMFEDLISDC